MINFLKDVSINTFIGELPSLINYNNSAIDNEFANIYDTSNNWLTKSLYSPLGSVEAHYGKFTNISCTYLTVSDPSSFQSVMSQIPHNMLSKRFSKDNLNAEGKIVFCHDLAAIDSGLSSGVSLASRLSSMDVSIQRIYQNLSIKDNSGYVSNSDWTSIAATDASIADSSYQAISEIISKLYGDSASGSSSSEDKGFVQTYLSTDPDYKNYYDYKSKSVNELNVATGGNTVIKEDLKDNGYVFDYYTIDSSTTAVKIRAIDQSGGTNDGASMYCSTLGKIVSLIFPIMETATTSQMIFSIRISAHDANFITVTVPAGTKTAFMRLRLISVANDYPFDTKWVIYDWSLPSNVALTQTI